MIRNKTQQLLLAGRFLSLTAISMTGLTAMLLAFDLTQNSAVAGGIATLSLLGILTLTLPAGVWADRYNRKHLMAASTFLYTILLLTLALTSALGSVTLMLLSSTIFLLGAIGALYNPAQQALLRYVSTGAKLEKAITANQVRSSLATVIGPPLAGVLYGISASTVLFTAAFLSAGALMCTLLVKKTPATKKVSVESLSRGIRQGVSYLTHQPNIRLLIILTTLTSLGVYIVYMGMTLALQKEGIDSAYLGLFQTAFGIGSILGATIAPAAIRKYSIPVIYTTSFSSLLIISIVSSLTVFLPHLMGLIGLVGVIVPILSVTFFSYCLKVTPQSFQGRTTSSLTLLTLAIVPLASFGAGMLLQYTDRFFTLVAGAFLISISLFIARITLRVKSFS